MKVVLDTNIVVSGLLHSEGNPGQILALVLSGAVQICHDERILAEYREVLARPRFKLNPERVKEILLKLESDGTSVSTGAESGTCRTRTTNLFSRLRSQPWRTTSSRATFAIILRPNAKAAPWSRLRSLWRFGDGLRGSSH